MEIKILYNLIRTFSHQRYQNLNSWAYCQRGLVIATAVIFLNVRQAPAQEPQTLENMNFEQGAPGQVPSNWSSPAFGEYADYGGPGKVELDRTHPYSGQQCLHLRSDLHGEVGWIALRKRIDGRLYRGRHVRLTAALRAEVAPWDGRALLYLQTFSGTGRWARQVPVDNLRSPVTTKEWKIVQIDYDVPENTTAIVFGTVLTGKGDAWADDFTFQNVGRAAVPHPSEVAHPLSARGKRNLVAFSRLLAVLQFFHPSDACREADWSRLAIEGIRQIEGADSDRQLRKKLHRFMAGLVKPAASGQHWRHEGVELQEWTQQYRYRPGVGNFAQLLPLRCGDARRLGFAAGKRSQGGCKL
jgi:hypothetical protein